MKTFGAFLNNNWARSMKEELDPFAVLNAALHRDGAFIYLPPKQKIEAPIQILHLIDAHDEPMWILPRIHVFAGAFSEAKLYSTQDVLSGEKYCLNQVMELNLEEGALLQLGSSAYKQNSGIWKFEAIRALLKRSSSFKSVDINQGGETSRYDYKVLLTQENAEVSLSGAALLNESDESHTNVLIDHQAPYCRSMQLFKGICTDFSRSTFEGKILVRKQAQKTEAFQLNNHLLLSDRAIAYSKPNLEIYADDVKASHGATVGQLDREQLFYLKARGFSDYEAKELLIKGFYKEVIDLLEFPYLKQRILEKVKGFSLPKKVSTAV